MTWEDEEAMAFDSDIEKTPWVCRCFSCRQWAARHPGMADYLGVARDVAATALSDAPCSRCGYNGPGYYQPETHPCAKLGEQR